MTIDKEIAEKVMGIVFDDGKFWPPYTENYSTDINCAMTVVEKMREKGRTLVIKNDTENVNYSVLFTALWASTVNEARGSNSSLPMAICFAALEATKMDEKLLNDISSVVISPDPYDDNLAIALCTYFSSHPCRPDDDPETERGWGEWVEIRSNEAIRTIAAVLKDAE